MRVLLVPGGGSAVEGSFPGLAEALGDRARAIGFDPPGFDPESGRVWLRVPDHARWLAEAVRRDGPGPVVVVGHSLGGLVGLRLALDEPGLVLGLLLLDPTPLVAALLPGPVLRTIAAGRRAAGVVAPRGARRRPARAPAAESAPLRARIRWFFVLGGLALAADIAAVRPGVAAVLVSAGAHEPGSPIRRAHERLGACLPGARLEVWPETTHDLHRERPDRVAETVLALLDDVTAA